MRLDMPSFSRKLEVTEDFHEWMRGQAHKLILSWMAVWATILVGSWLLGGDTVVSAIISTISVIAFLIGVLAAGLRLIWLLDD